MDPDKSAFERLSDASYLHVLTFLSPPNFAVVCAANTRWCRVVDRSDEVLWKPFVLPLPPVHPLPLGPRLDLALAPELDLDDMIRRDIDTLPFKLRVCALRYIRCDLTLVAACKCLVHPSSTLRAESARFLMRQAAHGNATLVNAGAALNAEVPVEVSVAPPAEAFVDASVEASLKAPAALHGGVDGDPVAQEAVQEAVPRLVEMVEAAAKGGMQAICDMETSRTVLAGVAAAGALRNLTQMNPAHARHLDDTGGVRVLLGALRGAIVAAHADVAVQPGTVKLWQYTLGTLHSCARVQPRACNAGEMRTYLDLVAMCHPVALEWRPDADTTVILPMHVLCINDQMKLANRAVGVLSTLCREAPNRESLRQAGGLDLLVMKLRFVLSGLMEEESGDHDALVHQTMRSVCLALRVATRDNLANQQCLGELCDGHNVLLQILDMRAGGIAVETATAAAAAAVVMNCTHQDVQARAAVLNHRAVLLGHCRRYLLGGVTEDEGGGVVSGVGGGVEGGDVGGNNMRIASVEEAELAKHCAGILKVRGGLWKRL
jgi:hypothetical protein